MSSSAAPVATHKSILGPVKVLKAPLKRDEGPDPLKRGPPISLLGSLGSFFRPSSPSSSMSISTASTRTMDSDDASLTSSSIERRRGLTFDEEVSVVHIPRREQYSKRIQEHLWHSAELLQNIVMRNTIEYAADGWKWENVREEDQHMLCPESGGLIHPVHQEIAKLIRQEQGLPEDAPVWTPFLKAAPLGPTCATNPVNA